MTGFQPGKINPGFGYAGQVGPAPRIAPKLQENPLNRNNPGQESCRAKQNNQDGTLTREQRRNLPSPDDVIISEQNVIIRDGQDRYKIKNHGHEFRIESTQNLKGCFKTEKTPKNIQAFKKEITEFVSTWKLTAEDFRDELLHLWEKDRDKFAVNCEPTIALKEFAKWMDKIFSRCEVFEPEV